jgi:hypothetical protein
MEVPKIGWAFLPSKSTHSKRSFSNASHQQQEQHFHQTLHSIKCSGRFD